MALSKIITGLGLAMITVVIALFIFRASHVATPQKLANDVGFIFPAPREVKPFELVSTTHQRFTQQNFYQHWTLLFFGFSHCKTICPATLHSLKQIYNELQHDQPNLQVVFISIDPKQDTPDELAHYLQTIHPAFIGASGQIQELNKMKSQFGIFSGLDPNDSSQIMHSPSLLLINPHGQWVGMINSGKDTLQIISSLKNVLPLANTHV